MYDFSFTLQSCSTCEFMINEAMEGMEGVAFNGINMTDLRYADDAVLVADRIRKVQKMIDRLSETCKAYGMVISVKRTILMIMNKMRSQRGCSGV